MHDDGHQPISDSGNLKKCIKSIGFRIQKHIGDYNIPLDIITPASQSTIPPWKLIKPSIDTSLSELKKLKQTLFFLKLKFGEFKHSKRCSKDKN